MSIDASSTGSTPSNFRLYFSRVFVPRIRTKQKTATLRLVKKSEIWWRTIENALRNGNGVVRAQTDRANITIFGWARVISISAPAEVLSFLNPSSKIELGCEGWTDDRYITEWCDGDCEAIVRRIDFTFVPYADIPDYQYTKDNVAKAVDKTKGDRLRHKDSTLYGRLKFAKKTDPPPVQSHPSAGSGRSRHEMDLAPRMDILDHTIRLLQGTVGSLAGSAQETKEHQVMGIHKRALEQAVDVHTRLHEKDGLALVAQQKALEREQALLQASQERERHEMTQHILQARQERDRIETMLKAQLHREQQVNDAQLRREQQLNDREQKVNDDARANAQYVAVETMKQNFFLELLRNPNFSSLVANQTLQTGAMSMLASAQPTGKSGPPSSSSSTTESTHRMLTSHSSGTGDVPSSV